MLLPAAYRVILPPMTTDVLATLKNTSVALTIGLAELTARARSMQEFSFQVFEAYAAATVAYGAISLVVTVAASSAGAAVADPRATVSGLTSFDFDVIGRSRTLPVPGGHAVHAAADGCWRRPAGWRWAR